MKILGLCKINNEENPSEKSSAETYDNSQNAQLNKIKNEIKELTDGNADNDKIEIQGTLTTEFVNYLKSNNDVAIALIDAVKKIDYDNLDEDNKKTVDNLKNFLEPIVNKSFSDTYDVSGLYNMQSTNNDEKGKFANGVDVAPEGSESKVKNLLTDINTKFSNYESILNDENNKDIKTTLEKVKMVLENPVERNVKILQKVIYDNLDDGNKNKFLQENKNKKNYNDSDMFDGKFGKCMVEWTKKGLQIIENNLKSLKDAQDVISESEKNNLLGKIKSDIVADANSDPKNWFDDLPEGTDVKFKDDSEKAKLNTVGDNTEIKLIVTTNGASEEISVKVKVVEKVQTNPKISESLKVGDVEYPIVNPQNVKNLPQMKGATFYLTTEIASPAPEGGEQGQQSPENENGERVFYLKFGNGDLFRVKVDNDGNLCPVATKMSNNLNEATQTLIKNNESCIKYLKNKLPSAIKDKCKIGWSGDDYVIGKDGYANWLTIEPMTIAGKWLSSGAQSTDLSDSLAFLNFTNFLRNEGKIMGVEFKDDNPDLTIQNDQLYVRVNRKINKKISKKNGEEKGELGWKYQKIDLRSFGLPGVDNPAFKNFIKYNNHEDWGDNWDKKPENKNYTKVDFPDIVVNNPSNPASSTTETASNEIPTPDPTVSTNSTLQKAQDESELDGVVVTGNRLKPKNPICISSSDMEVTSTKNGKLKGIGEFDGESNFRLDKSIMETSDGSETTIMIGNDAYTKIFYEQGKGLNIDDFTGKGYQVGNTGEMKWFYIGDYKEGQKSGTGTRIFENGAIYNGGWSEGRENGQGKYTYPNGDVYEGSFVEGQFNGQGTYTWKNGTKFEGEFKNDKMTEGKLIIKSGDGSEKDYNVKKDDNGLKIIEGNDAGKYVDLTDNVTDAPIEQNKAPEITSAVEPNDKSTEYPHQIVTNNSKVSVATVEEEPDSGNLGIEGIGYMNSDGEFLFDGNVEKFDGASRNFYIEIGDNNYFRLDDGDEVKDGYCYTIIGGPAEQDGIVIGNINNGKYEGNVIVVNKNYKYEGTVDGVYTKFNKGTITFPNGNKYEVEKDDKGLKIRSSGQYEGKYINADTGQIVDTAQ